MSGLTSAQAPQQASDHPRSDGSVCVTTAAKMLGRRRTELFTWMSTNGWIYKSRERDPWMARQRRLDSGTLKHQITYVRTAAGPDRPVPQVLVTPKGLKAIERGLNRVFNPYRVMQ